MLSEKLTVKSGDKSFEIVPCPEGNPDTILIDGNPAHFNLEHLTGNTYSLLLEGNSYLLNIVPVENGYFVHWSGGETFFEVEDDLARVLKLYGGASKSGSGKIKVKAPMPGLVVKILKSPGDEIRKGEPLLVVEAMKMENEISAPHAGKIEEIRVSERQAVEKGEQLLILNTEC